MSTYCFWGFNFTTLHPAKLGQLSQGLPLQSLCRLAAVESDVTDEEVEAKLEFQLEVLIKQSKDELGLIPLMAGLFYSEVTPI